MLAKIFRNAFYTHQNKLLQVSLHHLRPMLICEVFGFREFYKQINLIYEVFGKTCDSKYVSTAYDKSTTTLHAKLQIHTEDVLVKHAYVGLYNINSTFVVTGCTWNTLCWDNVTLKRSEKSTWHLFQVCLHGTLYIYVVLHSNSIEVVSFSSAGNCNVLRLCCPNFDYEKKF